VPRRHWLCVLQHHLARNSHGQCCPHLNNQWRGTESVHSNVQGRYCPQIIWDQLSNFWSCSTVSIISCRLNAGCPWMLWHWKYLDKWNHTSTLINVMSWTSPLAVGKSLPNRQYCTCLQLTYSFSPCTDVIWYGCRCSYFLSILYTEYKMLACCGSLSVDFFGGSASCNQKSLVLLTLVAISNWSVSLNLSINWCNVLWCYVIHEIHEKFSRSSVHSYPQWNTFSTENLWA
jgi:hypothetical protein